MKKTVLFTLLILMLAACAAPAQRYEVVYVDSPYAPPGPRYAYFAGSPYYPWASVDYFYLGNPYFPPYGPAWFSVGYYAGPAWYGPWYGPYYPPFFWSAWYSPFYHYPYPYFGGAYGRYGHRGPGSHGRYPHGRHAYRPPNGGHDGNRGGYRSGHDHGREAPADTTAGGPAGAGYRQDMGDRARGREPAVRDPDRRGQRVPYQTSRQVSVAPSGGPPSQGMVIVNRQDRKMQPNRQHQTEYPAHGAVVAGQGQDGRLSAAPRADRQPATQQVERQPANPPVDFSSRQSASDRPAREDAGITRRGGSSTDPDSQDRERD